jgi:hypothetical protein
MARKCQESNFKTCDWSGDDLDQAILENKIPGLGSGNDYVNRRPHTGIDFGKFLTSVSMFFGLWVLMRRLGKGKNGKDKT